MTFKTQPCPACIASACADAGTNTGTIAGAYARADAGTHPSTNTGACALPSRCLPCQSS